MSFALIVPYKMYIVHPPWSIVHPLSVTFPVSANQSAPCTGSRVTLAQLCSKPPHLPTTARTRMGLQSQTQGLRRCALQTERRILGRRYKVASSK